MTRIETTPFDDQKPGTSGLRKKTRHYMQPHYLENFVQSIFDAIGGATGKRFVLGGDGRFFNAEAAQKILKIAAANGAVEMIIGQNALLSTPAASHLIRINKTDGGIIMSASHNPGGIDEDFGVKFNQDNGGPAVEAITDAIHARTQIIDHYNMLDAADIDLSAIGKTQLGDMVVTVVDPVADYADYMETLFDFDAIRAAIKGGLRIRFDAMNAITGPYAVDIIERRLGAPNGTVVNGTPLPDFGGLHPDPNPVWAKALMDEMFGANAPDFGAASDGDGDRNMVVGRNAYVGPSDSLAIMAEHAHKVKGYTAGLKGLARSMPTGSALDRVAEAMGLENFETPTGWKFFGNLLDAGRVTLCGEESFGTGSDHVREKDGLWAVLFWINILAVEKKSVADLMNAHWARFGRTYFSRHDFEAIDSDKASAMINALDAQLDGLAGTVHNGLTITTADRFSYDDPVDGSHSANQGYRFYFDNGSRGVMRLSGTGTQGATMRLYLEQYDRDIHNADVQAKLKPVGDAVLALLDFTKFTGRTEPDVLT